MRVLVWLVGFLGPSGEKEKIRELFRNHELFPHVLVIVSESEAHGFVKNDFPFVIVEYSLASGGELVRILQLNAYSVVVRRSEIHNESKYSGDEILEDIARVVDAGALKKIRQDFSRGIVTDAYVCLRGLSAKQQKRIKGWKLKPSDVAGPKIALSETVQGSRFAARKRVIRWEQMAQALMNM